MNFPCHAVRPKTTVVKFKMRDSLDKNSCDGNELNQFSSREIEGEGSSRSSSRQDDQFTEKTNFNEALTATSRSNEDGSAKINIQLDHSQAFNYRSGNATTTLISKPGAEYWHGSGATHVIGQDSSRICMSVAPSMNYHGPGSGGSTEYWIQDEKEIKRQKRKEANRESARRSRMRKQAECDELAEKVQSLSAENETLRAEVDRLSDLCQKLSAENASLLQRLGK